MKIPQIQLILDYEMFFGQKPPEDRISIIKNVSKKHLLFELAGLNYRLKPKDTIFIDQSLDRQAKELAYFTQTQERNKWFAAIAARYTSPDRKNYPNIFNRPACLFAMEELTNSDLATDENFVMARIEVWDAILKYLLAVNYFITQIQTDKSATAPTVESLNPKLIPLNEQRVETDPLYTLYRGYHLMDYFANHSIYAEYLKDYLQKTYSLTHAGLIFLIIDIYNAKTSEIKEHNFYYEVSSGDVTVFESLSTRIKSKELIRLIGIRKSPFIKVGDGKYIIADNALLLEKTYYQFVNDFWFDYLKNIKDENGNEKISIKHYRSTFGYFFEGYLKQILSACFANYKHSILLSFNELLVDSLNGQIEICDVYLRYGNNVLVGEVKSGGIYDNEKYGGNVDEFYKNDRNNFFKNFGVDQVVKSVKEIETNIALADPKFPVGHTCYIYPCIIVNDKAFQTPMMNQVFNDRFQELMQGFQSHKMTIYPLTIIHIADLEKLEEILGRNPKIIWDYLQYGFRFKKFIMPFYSTINKLLPQLSYPEKIRALFIKLVAEFNPAGLKE